MAPKLHETGTNAATRFYMNFFPHPHSAAVNKNPEGNRGAPRSRLTVRFVRDGRNLTDWNDQPTYTPDESLRCEPIIETPKRQTP